MYPLKNQHKPLVSAMYPFKSFAKGTFAKGTFAKGTFAKGTFAKGTFALWAVLVYFRDGLSLHHFFQFCFTWCHKYRKINF